MRSPEVALERHLIALGAKPLRPLGWGAFVRAIPGLAGEFRAVPESYWTPAGDSATVRCPCGQEVSVAAERSASCQCERVYLFSRRLLVANSPKRAVSAGEPLVD